MLTCPNCGRENPADSSFCNVCGHALSPGTAREVRKTVTVLFCDVAGEGVAVLEPTEDVVRLGQGLMALAEVLRTADREEEALTAVREALALFERKGDVPDTARARAFIGES